MVREIRWTLRALDDLLSIYNFIAKDSKRYAKIQVENIQHMVLSVANFPLIGHVLSEFPQLPFREILVGSYRLIYRFNEEENRIVIVAVAHGRQKLRELSDD